MQSQKAAWQLRLRGLHFTPELREDTADMFGWEELTLHVGLGTFAPLKMRISPAEHYTVKSMKSHLKCLRESNKRLTSPLWALRLRGR